MSYTLIAKTKKFALSKTRQGQFRIENLNPTAIVPHVELEDHKGEEFESYLMDWMGDDKNVKWEEKKAGEDFFDRECDLIFEDAEAMATFEHV